MSWYGCPNFRLCGACYILKGFPAVLESTCKVIINKSGNIAKQVIKPGAVGYCQYSWKQNMIIMFAMSFSAPVRKFLDISLHFFGITVVGAS